MNNKIAGKSVLAAAVALALSGCVVSRVDPQKPDLPLPRALPAPAEATVQLPDPWWTLFADPTLDRLVEEALANNTDVRVAASRVAQARSALRSTNADRLPSVDLQGSANRSKDSAEMLPAGVNRYSTVYNVQGSVGFELDLWGRYQRASESARALLLNTEYGREATKLSLTGDVVRGLFFP